MIIAIIVCNSLYLSTIQLQQFSLITKFSSTYNSSNSRYLRFSSAQLNKKLQVVRWSYRSLRLLRKIKDDSKSQADTYVFYLHLSSFFSFLRLSKVELRFCISPRKQKKNGVFQIKSGKRPIHPPISPCTMRMPLGAWASRPRLMRSLRRCRVLPRVRSIPRLFLFCGNLPNCTSCGSLYQFL